MRASTAKNHQINHFGFRITDKKEWVERIKKYDLSILFGGPIQYPHSTSWYLEDPSGHEIEVSYTENDSMVFSK